jgi:hypothetical protein
MRSKIMPHDEQPSRRAFLTQTAVGMLLADGKGTGAMALPETNLRTSGSGPHFFLDDHLIAEQQHLTREIIPPKRLPQPIVTGTEDKCFQPYVTVIQNPQTKRFRIWYGVPESSIQSHVATMESDDGIHWKRPHRVLDDPGTIQFGVSILDEGVKFPKPEQRYKYAYWHDGGLQIAVSPDGLKWTKLTAEPVLKHNHDINNLYFDPIRKRYAANVSMYLTDKDWKGQRRVTYQSESQDLLRWSEPHRILAPDSGDEGETQFYCMGGVLARGETLIGMARVLRDDLPAEAGGPVAGLGYTTLTWSHDGQTWTRDKTPFLDRNAQAGAWDRAMTWVDCQLPVGDEVFLYYGGYKRGHKIERFVERQIGLARMPLDRYVARSAGKEMATLLTHPVQFAGRHLQVNANVKGILQVAVLDTAGKPIRGYESENCHGVAGDSLRHTVRWKQAGRSLKDRPVRLQFTLSDAQLFAFGFTDLLPTK